MSQATLAEILKRDFHVLCREYFLWLDWSGAYYFLSISLLLFLSLYRWMLGSFTFIIFAYFYFLIWSCFICNCACSFYFVAAVVQQLTFSAFQVCSVFSVVFHVSMCSCVEEFDTFYLWHRFFFFFIYYFLFC